MSANATFNPDFQKVNLLALYTTMYLKRIVVNKMNWKEHLNILYEEVKRNLNDLGKDKEKYMFSALRDFARMYGSQWSVKEYEQEVGKPAYYTMLIVLMLRLGIDRLWVPDCTYFRDDILVEGFLAHKPTLQLTYLSVGDALYDIMAPLCPNLYHVSMPFADSSLFSKTLHIKSLRVLEFSTGVSDKVLCQSLWNIDKKSDKVLQLAVKDKKEGSYKLTLPHLEILRSNIQMNKTGANSMKVTLGAAALALQPKMRIVENRRFWSTLQAIQALMEMESKYKIKHQKRLAVDRLLFTEQHLKNEQLESQLPQVLEMCPSITGIVITECYSNLSDSILTILKTKMSTISNLSLDVTKLSEQDFGSLLKNLGTNIKNLSLRINLRLIEKFHLQSKVASGCDHLKGPLIKGVDTLSIILVQNCTNLKEGGENDGSYQPTAMMSFLVCFSHIKTLNYWNMHWVPPLITVFGCIGGALAVMEQLKHLSLSGGSVTLPFETSKMWSEVNLEVKNIIPELINDSTFKVLKNLESFTIDEAFVNHRVDRFLDLLRACDVHVQIFYRPESKKGSVDFAKYLDCNEFDELYATYVEVLELN